MTVGELRKKLESIDPENFVFLDVDHDGKVLTEIEDVTPASGKLIKYPNTERHGLAFDHEGPITYLLIRPKKG